MKDVVPVRGNQIDASILKVLNLPEHVTKFTLTVPGDGPVTIDCQYYVTQEQCEAGLDMLKRYKLVEME